MSFFDLPTGCESKIKFLSLKVEIAPPIKIENYLLPLKMNNILNR